MIARPVSSATAISASLWRIAWCLPIGRPNGSRSLREVERALEQRLHRADRAERHQQPLPLEVGHDQVEALVLLAEQVLLGHEHVVERDLAGVGRVPAELLELGDARDALASVDDQERDAVVAALLGRLDGGDDEVGAHAVRDERLRAVDDVAAVDALARAS